MALDPDIILKAGVGVTPINTPLQNAAAQDVILSVRARAEDARQKALAQIEAQKAQQAFSQALQQTGGDYNAAFDVLDKQGINTSKPREDYQKSLKSYYETAQAAVNRDKTENEVASSILNKIVDEPSRAAAFPLLSLAMQQKVGTVYDADRMNMLHGLSSTEDQKHKWADESLRDYYENRPGVGAAKGLLALGPNPSPEDVAGWRQYGKLHGVPDFQMNSLLPDGAPVTQDVLEKAQAMVLGPQKPTAEKAGSDYHQYAERWAKEHGTTFENLTTKQEQQARKEYGQADDRPRVSVSVAGGQGGAGSDVKESVQGMIEGTVPPVAPGRATKEYLAVMAEAHRQKFDIAKANQDWIATQKYLGTLNGAQQVRLRQATQQVAETVPLVRSLVSEWDSAGIPALSKANLAAAKSGAYGNKAQSLAVRLDAQIADLTSELGTVYKGGNSSTDESLQLAARNLSADWSKKAALDALDQIETNIRYRRNSMRLPPVTGDAEGSPNRYAPAGLTEGTRPASVAKEGETRNIKGGGVATFTNGKWIRTQ